MKSSIYLSVVVTALNEESNVENCINKLSEFLDSNLERYEIIFVNDGSTDKTKEKLDSLNMTKNLTIIHLPFNQGTGGAIKEALPALKGEWYCWLPSDLEIQPEELLKPLALCSDMDVVVTYISNGHIVRTNFRNTLSKLFILIMNATFGTKLNYFNGVSLIKTKLLKNLDVKANRFFFHAELLLKVLQRTKKYTQTSISLTPRFSDRSKAMKPKIFIDVIFCFLRNVWDIRIKNENPNY